MARTVTRTLVVRSDGEMRVAKKPRIAWDEVAYRLVVTIPDGWGRVRGEIALTMPEPPDDLALTVTESDA